MATYVQNDASKREAADSDQRLAIILKDLIAGVQGKTIEKWIYSDRITSTYVDANPEDRDGKKRKCNHGLIPVIDGTPMEVLALTDWALARQTTNDYSDKDTYSAIDLDCVVRKTYLKKCLDGLKSGNSSPKAVLEAVAEELKDGKTKCSLKTHTLFGTNRQGQEYHGEYSVFTTVLA